MNSCRREQRVVGAKWRMRSIVILAVVLTADQPRYSCEALAISKHSNYRSSRLAILHNQADSGVQELGTRKESDVANYENVMSRNRIEVPSLLSSQANDMRYSASDWFQNIRNFPRSTILKATRGPVLAVMAWSTFVSIVYATARHCGWHRLASSMYLTSKPHSFLVSALGLLLVFRTNSAYQRFAEGRRIWEHILSVSRNITRMALLYDAELGSARIRRVFRLLAAFPYLLHQHIQPHHGRNAAAVAHAPYGLALTKSSAAVPERSKSKAQRTQREKDKQQQILEEKEEEVFWVDRRTVPWCLFPNRALQRCVESANRPLWVCDRLSQELTNVPYTDNFTNRERMAFLSKIDKLSHSIGECERIHQTAVPLNYARHSLRSLTLWLFTLPFVLIQDFGLLTGPAMGFISWLLVGIYQIGYAIEDPFQGSLRLSALCDAIYRDVMYGTDVMSRRLTAFEHMTDDGDEEEEERQAWSALDKVTHNGAMSLEDGSSSSLPGSSPPLP